MTRGQALTIAIVVAGLFHSPRVTATPADEVLQLTRLKPAGAEMRRLIAQAHSGSSTFRAMVAEIHRSNGVVMVHFGSCAGGRFRSCVTHVAGNEQHRQIGIKINPRGLEDRLMGSIAHELHHALEILREPGATNPESTMSLYRRIGTGKCRQGLSDACETDAALAVEARVLEEVYATPGIVPR